MGFQRVKGESKTQTGNFKVSPEQKHTVHIAQRIRAKLNCTPKAPASIEL